MPRARARVLWGAPPYTRALLLFASTLLAPLIASTAHASDLKTCDAAYEQAQSLRDARKLASARGQLLLCARAACPAFMAKDCTTWLGEVEPRIPSVILVALDAAGAALPNVSASMEGGAARRLDGTSWDVDPGQHTFTFVLPDGTRVDRSFLVVEGQKDQRVAVSLAAPPLAAPPPPAPFPVTSVPGGIGVSSDLPTPHAPAPDSLASPVASVAETTSRGEFPYRVVGFVSLGLGVAGIALGSIFGVEALSTKSAHCMGTTCDPGSAGTALGQGTVSTVGFVAGGVLAAGGLTLVLLAPSKKNTRALRLDASPLVGQSRGLTLRGTW
jgi:hypothetical protein